MDKEKRAFLLSVIVFLFIVFIWVVIPTKSEDAVDTTEMFVTASLLNGRAKPNKNSSVEAKFDHGDEVTAFDWSPDHHWIEIKGGETGTVWVWWEYLTERTDEFLVWNNWGTKIKIRSAPYGRVIGYLKRDGELWIDKVVLGWGHSNRGWIELKYLTEED